MTATNEQIAAEAARLCMAEHIDLPKHEFRERIALEALRLRDDGWEPVTEPAEVAMADIIRALYPTASPRFPTEHFENAMAVLSGALMGARLASVGDLLAPGWTSVSVDPDGWIDAPNGFSIESPWANGGVAVRPWEGPARIRIRP